MDGTVIMYFVKKIFNRSLVYSYHCFARKSVQNAKIYKGVTDKSLWPKLFIYDGTLITNNDLILSTIEDVKITWRDQLTLAPEVCSRSI